MAMRTPGPKRVDAEPRTAKPVPAPRAEGHHVKHWVDGGRTDLDNLVSLCRFHHRRHHEGRFQVRVVDGGEFRFETSDGVALQPVSCDAAHTPLAWRPNITPRTPFALSGGEPCDFGYAVSVIADAAAASKRGP